MRKSTENKKICINPSKKIMSHYNSNDHANAKLASSMFVSVRMPGGPCPFNHGTEMKAGIGQILEIRRRVEDADHPQRCQQLARIRVVKEKDLIYLIQFN